MTLLRLLHLVHEGISPEGPALEASGRSVLVTLPTRIRGSSALPAAICGACENDIASAADQCVPLNPVIARLPRSVHCVARADHLPYVGSDTGCCQRDED